jgi:hypothetical protein
MYKMSLDYRMYMLEQRRIAYIQSTTTDHIYHLKPQEKETESEKEPDHIRLKTKEERIQFGKEYETKLRLEREAGYRQQRRDDDAEYMSYVPIKLVPNLPIKEKKEEKEKEKEPILFYSRFVLPVRIKMG